MRLYLYSKKNLSNEIRLGGKKRRKTVLQRPYFVKDTCVYIQDYKRPLERLGTVCMEAEAAGSTVASRRSARGAREHGGRVAQCAVVNGARFLRPFEVAYVKAAFTVKDKRKKNSRTSLDSSFAV